MAKHQIYLTLDGEVLKWSPNGKTDWEKVTKTSPSTVAKRKDEVEWISNDDTIDKIMVKFNSTNIFKRVDHDDTKKPYACVCSEAQANTVNKYEILVTRGDAKEVMLTFDPEIKVPNPPE